MKPQALLLLILVFGLTSLHAQKLDTADMSVQERYDFHIQKKKTNNLIGWIALGSGVAMVAGSVLGGGADYVLDSINPNKEENEVVEWLLVGGSVVAVASIPFFIASGKHKRKARIQLQNGAVGFNRANSYKGIAISLNF